MPTPRSTIFRRAPRRRALAPALAAAVLVLTACGGTTEGAPPSDTVEDAPPVVAAPIAAALAERADAVVAGLDSGDVCGAAHLADDLLGEIRNAVSNGDLTGPTGAQLLQVGEDLQAKINCPDTAGKSDNGKKKKQKDDDDD